MDLLSIFVFYPYEGISPAYHSSPEISGISAVISTMKLILLTILLCSLLLSLARGLSESYVSGVKLVPFPGKFAVNPNAFVCLWEILR